MENNLGMCVCGHEKEKHDVAGSCQVMAASSINFCPCLSFRPAPSLKSPEDKISGYIALVLRTYQMYDYIDFATRSSSAKGTINWSEEVARFLIEQDPRLTQTLTTLLNEE